MQCLSGECPLEAGSPIGHQSEYCHWHWQDLLTQWIEVTWILHEQTILSEGVPFGAITPKCLKSKDDKYEYLLSFPAWIFCSSQREGSTLKWTWVIVDLNSGLKCFNHHTALWDRMFLLQKMYNDISKGLRKKEMNVLEREREKITVKP